MIRSPRRALALLAVATTALVATPVAAGAAAETNGENWHKQAATFTDFAPCLEGAFTIDEVTNGQFHEVTNSNGSSGTFTATGTVSGVPVDILMENGEPVFDDEESLIPIGPREGPSFTGRYTAWGGFNELSEDHVVSTFTFRVNLRLDDGTVVRFNSVEHFNGSGIDESLFRSMFSKEHCH